MIRLKAKTENQRTGQPASGRAERGSPDIKGVCLLKKILLKKILLRQSEKF